MGRGTKLYNLILPLWLLWIFPQTWLVVLPANFIVDLLVSALALRFAGARGIAGVLKFSILRTWLCGFAADAAGTALMAAPLITTIVDTCSLLILFLLATAIIKI